MATKYVVLARVDDTYVISGAEEALSPTSAAKKVLGSEYDGGALVVPERNATFLSGTVEQPPPRQHWEERDWQEIAGQTSLAVDEGVTAVLAAGDDDGA